MVHEILRNVQQVQQPEGIVAARIDGSRALQLAHQCVGKEEIHQDQKQPGEDDAGTDFALFGAKYFFQLLGVLQTLVKVGSTYMGVILK